MTTASPKSFSDDRSPAVFDDDLANPIHPIRDPNRLVGYLIPFPQPQQPIETTDHVPHFLVYTPPPPPLLPPPAGEKETYVHMTQRKWQEHVRKARHRDSKASTWTGMKDRATLMVDKAMHDVQDTNIEFLNRVPDEKQESANSSNRHAGISELVLVYPSSMDTTPELVREEFLKSITRTQSKADRHVIMATALLPITVIIDFIITPVWPFGGLAEVDAVWGVASFYGAKTARNMTKRLSTSSSDHEVWGQNPAADEESLTLNCTSSSHINVLERYLALTCHHHDGKMFDRPHGKIPEEDEVLRAIGWAPLKASHSLVNWEEDAWSLDEVEQDLKNTFKKAAKEWTRWCKGHQANSDCTIQ